MAETQQLIKDRLFKTAAAIWGHKGAQTENSFDPLVGILLGACAAELEKISHDIDETRGRTLERLVQLLYPEVLANAMPSHAVASALPSEKNAVIPAETQFYYTKKYAGAGEGSPAVLKNIYFSPTGPFLLQQSAIVLMAATHKVYSIGENGQKETVLTAPGRAYHPYRNSVWLGIENPGNLTGETLFYFELRNEAGRDAFYDALPGARWYQQPGEQVPAARRYPDGITVHGKPDPKEIVSGKTSAVNRILKQVNRFYAPHFITATGLGNISSTNEWPGELNTIYAGSDFKKITKEKLGWIRIDFPENIHVAGITDDLVISLNCFPVVNRQLVVTQQKLLEYINIIPLLSDAFFLDIAEVTDIEGNPLDGFNKQTEDSPVNIHYGGISRFNEKNAVSAVEGLIQQLRDESSAFSSIGNDFLNKELRQLQQSLNILEQQIAERHLLKADTPYLIIPDKEKTGTSNIYVKYWTTNGGEGNNIKAGSPLFLYKSADVLSSSVKLITGAMGGRDSLSNQDKVLAYKTALLSKEKLVTAEDIASFCRLRMALRDAAIEVKQGYSVKHDTRGGFCKTIDVFITLTGEEMRALLQNGTLDFWQQDLGLAITANASFFMPLRVFIQNGRPDF
jgi:Type VI secretion system, TssF